MVAACVSCGRRCTCVNMQINKVKKVCLNLIKIDGKNKQKGKNPQQHKHYPERRGRATITSIAAPEKNANSTCIEDKKKQLSNIYTLWTDSLPETVGVLLSYSETKIMATKKNATKIRRVSSVKVSTLTQQAIQLYIGLLHDDHHHHTVESPKTKCSELMKLQLLHSPGAS